MPYQNLKNNAKISMTNYEKVPYGDINGYAWGRSDIRIEVPITNQKNRQTYFSIPIQRKSFRIAIFVCQKTKDRRRGDRT
jgi:hypothetical protein